MLTSDNVHRVVGEESKTPGTQIINNVSEVLGRIFSVRLGVPDIVNDQPEKEGKKFCVGLLENPEQHVWWESVSGLGRRERYSISGSLFLARKVLPSPPDPLQSMKHAKLMSSPAEHPPTGYLEFVDREIDKLFLPGWDRRYASHVSSHSPTSSSCHQFSRSKGGAKRWLSEQGRDWFSDSCLGETHLPEHNFVRYSVVRTAGKNRGITVADGYHHVLGPLHRTLYDHLSQFEWLLRGEARGKKFRSFAQRKGEIFVSGDYESATDNLSLLVTERILQRILSHSRFLPSSLVKFAIRSLRAEIVYPDLGGLVVRQQRGQLMGNFLSFPLLCLHNYLTLRWSIPRKVPLKINGDDIVFRCRPSERDLWQKNVGAAGLTLSVGKTLVHSSVFSVNSAFFEAQSSGVREIPVIRSSWLEHRDGPPTGADFCRFTRNWKNESLRLVGALWLSSHRRRIQKLGRSVGKLGIPADNSQLHTAGLAPRESFFRGTRPSMDADWEEKLPIVSRGHKGQLCDEWVKVHQPILSTPRERCEWDRQYRDSCNTLAWVAEVSRDEIYWDGWWAQAEASGRETSWLSWKVTSKKVHKMGLRLNIPLRAPRQGLFYRSQWVPKREYPFRVFSNLGIGFR